MSHLNYIRAKNKVEKTKRFYTHLFIYVLVNLVITIFKVSGNLDSWSSFKNELISINVLSVWVIWGIVILIHFIAYTFGQEWEEQKIDKLMKNELSKRTKI